MDLLRADTDQFIQFVPGLRDAILCGGEDFREGFKLGLDGGQAARAHGSGASPGAALTQWRAATLAGMRAQAVSQQPFVPTGSLALPESVRLSARGQTREGRPVGAQAVWFAAVNPQGVWLFHAVIYADPVANEVADAFFAGLRLQQGAR